MGHSKHHIRLRKRCVDDEIIKLLNKLSSELMRPESSNLFSGLPPVTPAYLGMFSKWKLFLDTKFSSLKNRKQSIILEREKKHEKTSLWWRYNKNSNKIQIFQNHEREALTGAWPAVKIRNPRWFCCFCFFLMYFFARVELLDGTVE